MRRHADAAPYLLELTKALCYVDRAGGPEDCAFLAGGGRSGTTWLMEIINANRDHRVVFEPFAAHKVRFLGRFTVEQYIAVDDDDPEVAAVVDRVIHGRFRSWWTDQHNRTLVCRRRLIKAIRANLALGYIRRRYPRMPIVVILRHPCAASLSMIKLGYGKQALEPYLQQPKFLEDHLATHRELVRTTTDPLQMRVLRWCIQHAVMFAQLEPGDVHLMFYEELCEEPDAALTSMCDYLGRPYDRAMQAMIHRPSRQAREDSAILRGRSPVEDWQRHVTSDQLDAAVGLLERFGLSDVYNHDPRPNREAAERHLARDTKVPAATDTPEQRPA